MQWSTSLNLKECITMSGCWELSLSLEMLLCQRSQRIFRRKVWRRGSSWSAGDPFQYRNQSPFAKWNVSSSYSHAIKWILYLMALLFWCFWQVLSYMDHEVSHSPMLNFYCAHTTDVAGSTDNGSKHINDDGYKFVVKPSTKDIKLVNWAYNTDSKALTMAN